MQPQRLTLSLLALAAVAGAVRAQESGTTLEVKIQNGAPTQARATSAPPASRTAPSRSSRSLPPLPSRGTLTRGELRPSGQAAPQKVLARVGTVTAERAEIRTVAGDGGQVLSVVAREVNLAVMAETDSHYGVLMSNNALGWVPKAAVALIDFNTEVQVPGAPAPAAGQPAVDGLLPQEKTVLQEAFTYLGVPYVWAGNTRNGLDCSAFVKNVYQSLGVNLPRHSGDQARVGQPVSGDQLRPGDRLYFAMKGGNTVSHCGIYLGNGYFIHASTNHRRVAVDPIYRDSHYAKKLVAIRR